MSFGAKGENSDNVGITLKIFFLSFDIGELLDQLLI